MRLDSAKWQCSIYFCWINSSLQIFFGTKTAKTLIVFSLYKSWIYVNFKYFLLIKYCYLFSLQVIFEIFTCTFKHKILVISIFEVKWSKQLNCIYQQDICWRQSNVPPCQVIELVYLLNPINIQIYAFTIIYFSLIQINML